jgi:hypothetical protein
MARPQCGDVVLRRPYAKVPFGRIRQQARIRRHPAWATTRRTGSLILLLAIARSLLLVGEARLTWATADPRDAPVGGRRTPAPHNCEDAPRVSAGVSRVSAVLDSLWPDLSLLPVDDLARDGGVRRFGRQGQRQARADSPAHVYADMAEASTGRVLPRQGKGLTAFRLSETLDEVLNDLNLEHGSLASGIQTSPLPAGLVRALKVTGSHLAGAKRRVGENHVSSQGKARRSTTTRTEQEGESTEAHREQNSERVRSVPEAASLQPKEPSAGQTGPGGPSGREVGRAPTVRHGGGGGGGATKGLARPGYGGPESKLVALDDPLDIVHHQVLLCVCLCLPVSACVFVGLSVRVCLCPPVCICLGGCLRECVYDPISRR